MTYATLQSEPAGLAERLRTLLANRGAQTVEALAGSLVVDPDVVLATLEDLRQGNLVERLCPITGDHPDWVFYRWRRRPEDRCVWQRSLFNTDVHIRKESMFQELTRQW